MSRLWDTPEFWTRFEADELLRDYPDTDVGALADMFERSLGSYDGDPDLARDIIGELRRRANAGIRFWPVGLSSVQPQVDIALAGGGAAGRGQRRSDRSGPYGLPG